MRSVEGQFQPPFDFVPSIGYMVLNLAEGKLDEAAKHNDIIETALTNTGREDLRYLTRFTDGVIMRERGQHEQALELLRGALSEYRSSIQQSVDDSSGDEDYMILELARAYLLAERPADALAILTELFTTWPSHPEANWLRARAHFMLGDLEGAESAQAQALAMWANAEPGYKLAAEARAGL